MSTCLNDARVRAVADGEGLAPEQEHAAACGTCGARVEAARHAAGDLESMARQLRVPASLSDPAFLDRGRHSGATTLRDAGGRRSNVRMWALAGAAAAVLAVVFVFPPLDSPRTISAAEVLDRSLQTLSAASGVELREFDLELQLPEMASARNGTYRIEQIVDHGAPGRFRAVRYAPDGTLLDAISQEPAAGRRTVAVNVDGQLFVFRFTTAGAPGLPVAELERAHVEAVIRVLQATAGQTLREVGDGGSTRYVVELPPVAADGDPAAVWALSRARAVIDAGDYHILELAAAGSYLGEPFSVAFRLRNRQAWSSTEVPPSLFDVPVASNAIEVDGVGSEDPGRDVLAAALRELARLRR